MRIFISYSSKYRDLCDRLQLALEADGRHEVFVDRTQLTPGQPFDTTLRQGIEDCDLFVFLLSPESVAPGSYALAELSLAKARWRHPGGHVLPVKVAPMPKDAIPAYLRAVTILEPLGDVVAETVAAVENVKPPSRRRLVLALAVAGVVLAGVLGTVGTLNWKKQRNEQARAAAAASAADASRATALAATVQLCESGNHALAWQRFTEIGNERPEQPAARRAQEDCAMRWLREIRVQGEKDSFTAIVERVLPVLAEGAAAATGQRGSDLRAHMGWADHLRKREGIGGLDPQAHYRQALTLAADNVYAHTMAGHLTMVQRGPIEEARRHFSAALAGGREHAWVRSMQFAALLYYTPGPGQVEAARAANDMRQRGEPVATAPRDRLWTYVYYDTLLSPERRQAFVAAAHDVDAAATFLWLFPEADVRPDRRTLWRYFLASLEEAAGNRAAARARFEALRDEFKREGSSGRIVDMTLAALKRLQAP
ncbi:MAG: toll/interleukin-1 receptor domain-containing protein [Burkholderiales bacterium]|nr:toll/interleukin-1 receptor domain-containing protein [Burkholderiales bacterium]